MEIMHYCGTITGIVGRGQKAIVPQLDRVRIVTPRVQNPSVALRVHTTGGSSLIEKPFGPCRVYIIALPFSLYPALQLCPYQSEPSPERTE